MQVFRKSIPFLLLLTAAAIGHAQELKGYLASRNASKITAPLSQSALGSFMGAKAVELQVEVKGSIRMGDEITLMLALKGGAKLQVSGEKIPEWLTNGGNSVRMIVKLNRSDELSAYEALFVNAVPENVFADWELKNQPKAVKSEVVKRKTSASRSGGRPPRMEGNIPGGSTPEQKEPVVSVSAKSAAALDGLPINEALPYYVAHIRKVNPKLGDTLSEQIGRAIIGYSLQFDLDARLIMAIINTESHFRPNLVSRAGAMGLGQLMPVNVKETGISSAFDPIENIYGTCFLIRRHLNLYHKKTDGDPEQTLILALAGYNAGDGNVRKYGGVPPFKETQNYVKKVTALFRQFRGE